MSRPLLALPLVLLAVAAGCGGNGDTVGVADSRQLTAAEAQPAASRVSTLLGQLADVPDAHDRLAFVDPAALGELDAGLPAKEIVGLVLGERGAQRAASAEPVAVAQLGAVTVLANGRGERTVLGAGASLARELESTTPATSILAPETASALQSCLGDPAAEVIRGSSVLGPTSGFGISLLDTADAPAGPKLHLCAAPHYVRELHAVEERFKARFPAAEVGQDEIGEREIVRATLPLAAVGPTELRALLSGGPALLALARG